MMTDDTRAEFNDIVRTELADTATATVRCECQAPDHHSGGVQCCHAATHFVTLHRWGWCDQSDEVNPDSIDADGNITAFMCNECANDAWRLAQKHIRQLLMSLPPGQRPHCPTCGRPTHLTADIIEKRPI